MLKRLSVYRYLTLCVLCLLLATLYGSGCKQKEGEVDAGPPQIESEPEVWASHLLEANEAKDERAGKQALRILFAGHPGSAQEKEFAQFLSKHFAHVATTDLKGYREDQSDDFDVTILAYDGDGFKSPRPSLSRDFSRPLLTVGVTGAFICGNLGLKTNYL
jgi:hypothetical protein